LDKIGETSVSRRRPVLARMARQKTRRPQLVRIAVILWPCRTPTTPARPWPPA
jgi:hypothetical protein